MPPKKTTAAKKATVPKTAVVDPGNTEIDEAAVPDIPDTGEVEALFVTYAGSGGGASHGGVPGVFFARGKVVEVTAEQWALLEGADMGLVLCDAEE